MSEYRFVLPLPPPDNALHRYSAHGSYATSEYQDWLKRARAVLLPALVDHIPDLSRWWEAEVSVYRGKSGDTQNFSKALLDVLSGARPSVKGDRSRRTGKELSPGTIIKEGLFWDDDRRVRTVRLHLMAANDPEPTVEVVLREASPPPDRLQEAKARAAAEALVARLQARADAWNAKYPVGTRVTYSNPGYGEHYLGCATTGLAVMADGSVWVPVDGIPAELGYLKATRKKAKP